MIGAIISLIIGIIFLVVATNVNDQINNAVPQINHGYAVCNSNLGRLGQILSGNMAQQCNQVPQAISLVAYGNVGVIVFYMIGGGCTAYGAVLIIGKSIIKARRANYSKPIELLYRSHFKRIRFNSAKQSLYCFKRTLALVHSLESVRIGFVQSIED
jgi:hypothetical protein